MTTFQLLKANESLLRLITENKVNVADMNHLDLYLKYEEMKKEGHKVGYIVVYLADKYGMTDRGVYKVIRRLSKQISFG